MLIKSKFVKGKPITNLQGLKKADRGIWVAYKDKPSNQFTEYVIDNPYNCKQWGDCDDAYQSWLNNALKVYDMWERVEQVREPIFSEDIDNKLDDILSSFAYDYSDSEYYQEEIMENLLKQLKEEFIITKI